MPLVRRGGKSAPYGFYYHLKFADVLFTRRRECPPECNNKTACLYGAHKQGEYGGGLMFPTLVEDAIKNPHMCPFCKTHRVWHKLVHVFHECKSYRRISDGNTTYYAYKECDIRRFIEYGDTTAIDKTPLARLEELHKHRDIKRYESRLDNSRPVLVKSWRVLLRSQRDYWMPPCDACDVDHIVDTTTKEDWPRFGHHFSGYRRPFRNPCWTGFLCLPCIVRKYPNATSTPEELLGIETSETPKTCSVCKKNFAWR